MVFKHTISTLARTIAAEYGAFCASFKKGEAQSTIPEYYILTSVRAYVCKCDLQPNNPWTRTKTLGTVCARVAFKNTELELCPLCPLRSYTHIL